MTETNAGTPVGIAKRVVVITAQHDDEPFREIEPRTVFYDTWEEALAAVRRTIEAGACAMVSLDTLDEADGPDDPDLIDWPAERHVKSFSREEIRARAMAVLAEASPRADR